MLTIKDDYSAYELLMDQATLECSLSPTGSSDTEKNKQKRAMRNENLSAKVCCFNADHFKASSEPLNSYELSQQRNESEVTLKEEEEWRETISQLLTLNQSLRRLRSASEQLEQPQVYSKMSRLPPLDSTNPLDWQYLAEGGANLVLSYSGSQPAYKGRVLRLRKRKKLHHTTTAGEADIDFAKEIVEPLLGKDQVTEMELVQLDRGWLQEMHEILVKRKSRPREREDEDEIDSESRFGVIAEDLVGGKRTIAFEIKVSPRYLYRVRTVSMIVDSTAEMGFPPLSRSPFSFDSLNQDDLL